MKQPVPISQLGKPFKPWNRYTYVIFHIDGQDVELFECMTDDPDHAVMRVYLQCMKAARENDYTLHPTEVCIDKVLQTKPDGTCVEVDHDYYPENVQEEVIDEQSVAKVAEQLSCRCGSGSHTQWYVEGTEVTLATFSHFYCSYCGDTIKHRWNRI